MMRTAMTMRIPSTATAMAIVSTRPDKDKISAVELAYYTNNDWF